MMLNYRFFGLMFVLLPAVALAQRPKSTDKNSIVMIVGKPLSRGDSVMVTHLFYEGLREKTMENPSVAANLFSQVLQIDPANDAGMYELAGIRSNEKKDDEARALLEKAVTVAPDNEWYWVALAGSYEKADDVTKLENVFRELVRINPEKPEYYTDEAKAFYLDKKYPEALAVYDQLENHFGKSEESASGRQQVYAKQGNVDLATKSLEDAISADPQDLKAYLQLSGLYNNSKQYDKALAVLLAATKKVPDNPLLHLGLADVYRDQKDYLNCFYQLKTAFAFPALNIEEELRIIAGYFPKFPDKEAEASALELSRITAIAHPDDARAFAVLGDVLMQNENYKEAAVSYRKSLALNEQTYAVWERLVRIDLTDNQYDAAVKDAQEALTLFPNQAALNYLLGVAYTQKAQLNEAINYFKNAVALAAGDQELLSQIYAAIGDAYHQQKNDPASDEAYGNAIINNPDNAYALNNYAYYLALRAEKLDDAAKMAQHSNQLEPQNASFEDTFAWVLFKQKKYAEAKNWIEKAVAHNKNSAGLAEHYADILFFTGDVNAAVTNWKLAQKLGSKTATLEQKINEKKYIE